MINWMGSIASQFEILDAPLRSAQYETSDE